MPKPHWNRLKRAWERAKGLPHAWRQRQETHAEMKRDMERVGGMLKMYGIRISRRAARKDTKRKLQQLGLVSQAMAHTEKNELRLADELETPGIGVPFALLAPHNPHERREHAHLFHKVMHREAYWSQDIPSLSKFIYNSVFIYS